MAHENLKFALQLDRKDWQPIMGAQDYGTFYMVYIRIKNYQKQEEDGVSAHTYTVDFKLQNFTGPITMGLTGSPLLSFEDITQTVDEKSQTTRWAKIKIDITPFTVNNEIIDYKLIATEALSKGSPLAVIYNRQLPPAHIYNPNDLDNSVYLNPHAILRDGDDYMDIALRKNNSDQPFTQVIAGPPFGICNPSHSIIM